MPNAKQIRTDAELDAALSRIGELLTAAPGSPQYDELNALSNLVQAYENRCYPIGLPSVAGAIEFHMEQQGLTLDDLAPLLGGKQAAAGVLSGKGELTMPMARALYLHWGISPEILLQEPGG